MKVIYLRSETFIKIFEVELREIAPWKGGYEKPSKYRTVILIIDHFCRSDPVKGIYLMFWVSTGWQTVGQSSVKLANSWSVFCNDDIKFGRSPAMLANSWAVLCVTNKNSIIPLISRETKRKQRRKDKKEETSRIFFKNTRAYLLVSLQSKRRIQS